MSKRESHFLLLGIQTIIYSVRHPAEEVGKWKLARPGHCHDMEPRFSYRQ